MATTKKVALVTGASSGIGKLSASALAKAGFEVIGTSRNTAKLTPSPNLTYLDIDVTSDDSVTDGVQQVIERFGRIDVLLNNAGMGSAGAAEETTIEQDQRVFDLNVFGLVRMTKAVLPHMRAQGGGRIINISSIFGFMPSPFMASYVATKHAVEGYSESLDHEVRDLGIRVLLVEPAATKTNFDTARFEVEPAKDAQPSPYAAQRKSTDIALDKANKEGDDPQVVADAVVAAATDRKPKMRYTPGKKARQFSVARRFAPAGFFDKQIRKFNGLDG